MAGNRDSLCELRQRRYWSSGRVRKEASAVL